MIGHRILQTCLHDKRLVIQNNGFMLLDGQMDRKRTASTNHLWLINREQHSGRWLSLRYPTSRNAWHDEIRQEMHAYRVRCSLSFFGFSLCRHDLVVTSKPPSWDRHRVETSRGDRSETLKPSSTLRHTQTLTTLKIRRRLRTLLETLCRTTSRS